MITETEVRRNVAANLVVLLADRQWSQSELARRASVNQPDISRLIRQENIGSVALMARIAEALHVSVDRLIAEPPTSRPARKVPQPA